MKIYIMEQLLQLHFTLAKEKDYNKIYSKTKITYWTWQDSYLHFLEPQEPSKPISDIVISFIYRVKYSRHQNEKQDSLPQYLIYLADACVTFTLNVA